MTSRIATRTPPRRARGARSVARLLRCRARWTLALAAIVCAANGARAIDLDVVAAAQTRQALEERLESARAELDQARAEAEQARQQLDAFLTRHFDQQSAAAPPQFEPSMPEAAEPAVEAPHPDVVKLEAQIEELRLHRLHLLTYLTEAHPEVIECDVRMATISQRLVALRPLPELPTPGDTTADITPIDDAADVERQWADFVQQHKQQSNLDAAEYERLFDRWRRAEEALAAALERWDAAGQAIVLLPKALATEPAPQPGAPSSRVAESAPSPTPATDAGTAPETLVAESAPPAEVSDASQPSRGEDSSAASGSPAAPASAPLALVALLIALAVAAFAAVRLARSGVDPVFATVDEVAAALSIPVVGVLPAGGRVSRSGRSPSSAYRTRNTILLLAMGGLVVLLGVLAIANAEGLGDLVRESISGMR